MSINDKIGLGTVQFGLKYGINNTSGQVSYTMAGEIIRFYRNTVAQPVFDTASAYGESELVLGRLFSEPDMQPAAFQVVSKFAADVNSPAALQTSFQRTLERLHVNRLYAFLAHDANVVAAHPDVYDALVQLKELGLVQKIGISAYFPSQLQWLLDKGMPVDLVQVPYNVFDRRFEPLFEECKRSGIEVHTRSAFLQGLFFREPAALPAYFSPVKSSISSIRQLAVGKELPLNKLLLLFCLTQSGIDRVIIGVDSAENIRSNIITTDDLLKYEQIADQITVKEPIDDDMILPFKWPAL